MVKKQLLRLLDYNKWANNSICSFVNAAGEDRAAMEQKSSFPSIQKTILHILDAQEIWLMRLREEKITGWPSKNFSGTTAEACVLLINSSQNLADHILTITDPEATIIEYQNLKGLTFSNNVFEIVMHIVNHGTYHRGQVITLLRGSGYDQPGSTDLINFYREQ
jgi:uncharacterized damage-inducible protein DinB